MFFLVKFSSPYRLLSGNIEESVCTYSKCLFIIKIQQQLGSVISVKIREQAVLMCRIQGYTADSGIGGITNLCSNFPSKILNSTH